MTLCLSHVDSLNGDTITYIFNGLDMSSVEDLNEDIKVFPTTDYEVNVQINKPITNGEARILNLIGQEVSKTNIVQEQTRIDVRLLPKGCYFGKSEKLATPKAKDFISC